jgi:cell division protease FtsH
MKQEIRMNTTGFLKHREQLIQYGLPQKRGIILAGEPGNGKTIICRALMSEADGITCISSDPYAMCQESYISDLFAIARDLSPSLVFLEDLDFIGQGRDDHFRGETALVALLASMDDIGENQAIVTVGTTNRIEAMDRALSERPSRFDRVFKIERPDGVQRLELLQHMAQKIPLTQDVMEYLVSKTAGFSAAQLQEVSFGMVIARVNAGAQNMEIKCADVDSVIPLINMHKTGRLGFNAGRHNN